MKEKKCEYQVRHGLFVHDYDSHGEAFYRRTIKVKKIGWNVCTPYFYDEELLKFMDIPRKFEKQLACKSKKWNDMVEFTIASKNGVSAIAIVSQKDNFNRKLGTKIATGRLRRMLSDRSYNPVPYFIDKPEKQPKYDGASVFGGI